MAYFSFPPIISFLSSITQNVDHEALNALVNTFLPGVSIILGTYFSLTLSILYKCFSQMQLTMMPEAGISQPHGPSHLSEDADALVEGVQCITDQIVTLVQES